VLAAIALAAVLVALVGARQLNGSEKSHPRLRAAPATGSDWNVVRAGVIRTAVGERTACGVVITATTTGVAHPSLPCGAKIFLAFGNSEVLTQVIERGPYVPGRGLDLTPALAARLGFQGSAEVRWRFAR
jgi:hypothetical protein